MKNIILAAFCLLFSCASAQNSTSPRFGVGSNNDNTYRTLNLSIVTTTDVTSATLDTIVLVPNAFLTVVRPSANLADSVCYKFSSTTTNYRIGDQVTFMVAKGTGAGKIKFGGSKYALSTASAAVLLAANKSLSMSFWWNGSVWIEATRVVTP